jgi:signal transduction histidine kinase
MAGPHGNGLVNLRERLAAMGGKCDIDSRPGQGTKLILTVPLNLPARSQA